MEPGGDDGHAVANDIRADRPGGTFEKASTDHTGRSLRALDRSPGERQRAALLWPSLGFVCLVVAGYLYSSTIRIENDCVLAEDRVCAAATQRGWAAAGFAAAFVVITGVVGVVFALRAARDGRT